MFNLDNVLVITRRAYSRKVSVLLSTMGDENDVDTGVEIGELSEEFTAWRDQWDRAWELNDRDYGGFEAFVDAFGMAWDDASQLEDTIKAYEDAYIGYQSPVDYAEDYVDSSGMLDETPEQLRNHIDYESIARDMVLEGSITEHNGHLFHSNW